MLWQNQEVQLKIKRSLDRLTETVHNQNIQILLPAMAFTTKLLENYANVEKNHLKTSYYQMVMVKLIEEFQKRLTQQGSRQFTNLSKNKKKIVAEILKYFQKYKNSSSEYTFLQSEEQKGKKNKLESLIKHIYQYYEEHNLDKAYERICQLNAFQPSLNKQILMEQHEQKILKIEKQYQKMIHFYSQLTSPGWISDIEQDKMKMYYKVFQQEKTISVKIEAELELQMLPFLAIINQIQLHYTYVPFTYLSNIIKILARNKKAAYSKVYVPLLTDRECYYYAVGYDRMSTTQSIFVYGETYDEDLEMQKEYQIPVLPAEQSEYVRLKVDHFCMQYKPISKTKAQVIMVSKANFKLTFLPLFILQKSARIFTFDYFNNIVKNAKNYKGSEFEKRVNANPSLYNFFQSKVDQYLN